MKNQRPQPSKPIMSTKEVAEFLGITTKEVRRLNEQGYLKSIRGYRKPRKFASHRVQEFLEA